MKSEKKRNLASAAGIMIVCLLAVGLSVFSIASTIQMHETAATIYDHPYTVSKEARAMETRLLDMRGFILNMLNETGPVRNVENLQLTLNNRYEMQYESLAVITEQYLGPKEDTDELLLAMQELEKTQNAAVPVVYPMEAEETTLYVEENLYPRYDAVGEALTKIIAYVDGEVLSLEKEMSATASRAVVSAIALTVFLPAYFLMTFWREQKNIREIRYQKQLFDVLSASVDEVFLIFNKEQNALEYVSSNSERVLGVKEELFTHDMRALREQVEEEDRASFDAFVQTADAQKGNSLDFRMRFPSGETRWIRLRMFPELMNGKAGRYIAALSDQTEEIRRQQVLKDALLNAQNANAAKQNFLSRMSHEIRTPMNAIIGMTTIAAAYIEDQKRVEDCLEKIGYSSKHLMTLINDVLDMSKIDEGKMTIASETFNLESVVESITSIIYPQAEQKGLDFTMPLVDLTNTILSGDALRLNQILLNLLSNALKFTPEGGSIRMEIRQLQKKNNRARLRFTVSDTGIGMSEKFMSRLFLPFEQESAFTGQKYGGTGLGMSITKNLVTLMGGTILVKSELEKGTDFIVELDFDIPAEVKQPECERQPSLESLNVLVADDDRDSCIHTSLLLERMGIASRWVLNGEECVRIALDAHKLGEDYDVCLIDWKMPDIDGIEVTRRVREFVGPDTTIVIITAYDWSEIEKSAREAGANAFLSKPIFASTLYNTLLSVTGMERAVRVYKDDGLRPDFAGRHVLLVEDNELNREIASELLSMVGLEVTCAFNGQEAVNKFLAEGDSYDLILMDVQMPVMDGYHATETIRKSGHPKAETIPIFAMTADAFHEDVVKAGEAGMNGHIAKPIGTDQLYQILEDYISKESAGKEDADQSETI